ncbi:MAG: CPBP family intramembrane metalloprotease [Planctomycetes bacterium]|nr:CPBP family intramembrane metalloprotease [Planctomycetota bacterium]
MSESMQRVEAVILRDARRDRRTVYVEVIVAIGLVALAPISYGTWALLHPDELLLNPAFVEWYIAAGTINSLVMIGLLWHLTQLRGETLRLFSGELRRCDLWWGPALAGFGIVSALLVLHVLRAGGWEDLPASATAFVMHLSPMLLLRVLVNALYEELFFRGFLQVRLGQLGWRGTWIVGVSVLIQMSCHIWQGTAACLALTPTFLLFAVFYQSTRRLSPVVLAHVMIGLFALIANQ